MNIKLNKVRLSFPNLFTTEPFAGEDTGKYSATLLLHKEDNALDLKSLGKAIKDLMTENKVSLLSEKICLKDGKSKSYDGYDGCWYIKASTKIKPVLLDRSKKPIEQEGVIYAGCYVNALVNIWYQNNQFGKRINAQLIALQFAAAGEPFGMSGGAAQQGVLEAFEADNSVVGTDDFDGSFVDNEARTQCLPDEVNLPF